MRLIDADALIKNLKISEGMIANGGVLYVPLGDVESSIINAPEIDLAKHGRWINMGDFVQCSCCTSTRMKEFRSYYGNATRAVLSPYCPNCGAKMDLEANENA